MVKKVDIEISKNLSRLLTKVMKMVNAELHTKGMGVTLILHPTVEKESEVEEREFQYISSLPRSHMHGAFRAIVKKWDGGGSDVPPHQRN